MIGAVAGGAWSLWVASALSHLSEMAAAIVDVVGPIVGAAGGSAS